MNDKEFNALERRSVILEQRLDLIADRTQLLSTMMKDYVDTCAADCKNINGDKLIGYANKIQALIKEQAALQKELAQVEKKFNG